MIASIDGQRRAGRALRATVPRSSHATFSPPSTRPDPALALALASRELIPELVAVRYERMSASPLAFLRGAAALMAADLAPASTTGLRVQAVGDAHLLNFGGFGTPDRRLLFDVDDFDETLPGPWEWDVKRLATSIELARRELGADKDAALYAARGYRNAMRKFAAMTALEVYRYELDAGDAVLQVPGLAKDVARWSHRSSRWELPRLTEPAGNPEALGRIADHAPVTVHVDGATDTALRALPEAYSGTLAEDRRALLARYRVVDVARHAVGIGSCGTRCYVILLGGIDAGDPLFLQVKEARRSALEPFAGTSHFQHAGQRVVIGQRLAQAGADDLLGWATMQDRAFAVRQLHDMRGAVDLATFKASQLPGYAALCGSALARAHARTGAPAIIGGYLGKGDNFDRAVAGFATAYADQTERDHAAFVAAIRSPD